jgi:tRNA U54 and U55 pseudouridine synthase Pus10
VACSLSISGAQARKQDNTEFKKKYSKDLKGQTLNCGVCHGKSKKMCNNYGKAVEKHLKAKNVKGAAVGAALDKAAKDPSHEKGKTFGDRIKAGMLPAEKK